MTMPIFVKQAARRFLTAML